jgi:glycosyltransferase involved in cell wall biosynthesis
MLHGNGRMLIRRARRDGAIVIGEPVNSHPRDLRNLVNEEHQRLGLRERETDNIIDRRLEDEARQCDYILAGSNVVKDSYTRNNYPVERIYVLPYGTDTRRFSPLDEAEAAQHISGLPECRFRVICVAQIIPRKGHVYLLEAWNRLKLLGADLVFIGVLHPIMRPILARYEGLFRHIPHVPHDQLRYYYGASHAFVLPSIEDGFAYVCTEALGCGLPVITTENTGAGEILQDGLDGFVVPIRSTEAIAERLEQLYCNEERRRVMGVAALTKARRDLSWGGYAKRVLAIYHQISPQGC